MASLLALLLILIPFTAGGAPPTCRDGIATLHGAFPAVLRTFPERRCDDCDGYIATLDCEEARQGKEYTVTFGEKTFDVVVADCESPAHAWALQRFNGKWLLDLDWEIWKQTDVPITPSPVTLCESTPKPKPVRPFSYKERKDAWFP